MGTSKDNIESVVRGRLVDRENELLHILAVGIESASWYYNASKCYVLLNSIDENNRTPDEISKLQRLSALIYAYEEKYYQYGN